MATRAEHIRWVRTRALEYLDGSSRGVSLALASVTSDLGKHPETERHAGIELGTLLAWCGGLSADAQMREWIEGLQ